MKKFRTLFTLLVFCCFAILTNAQTKNMQVTPSKQCASRTTIAPSKATTATPPVKKPLATTKQRRLKNYQSNHKIIRKRKSIKLENAIAAKE